MILLAAALFLCPVASIHDGDSLTCADGTRVRLAGIAARETSGRCLRGHPCPAASAEEATAELSRLVQGRTLRCEAAGRTYGRVAAWCSVDGHGVSCLMLASGTVAYWEAYDRGRRICR